MKYNCLRHLACVFVFFISFMIIMGTGDGSRKNEIDTDIDNDETYTNSLGMVFRLLPAGIFTMGTSSGEPLGEAAEEFGETQHQVTLTQAF